MVDITSFILNHPLKRIEEIVSKAIESQKYFLPVMLYLLEHGKILKYDLQKDKIVTSSNTLDNMIELLQKQAYITVEEKIVGRRTYEVSLTDKGIAYAMQLKKAQEVAKGEITEEGAQFKMPPDWRERFRGLSAMTHLNVLDDHVAIQEIDHSGKTTSVIMVYVKRINSHFELWCEKDETHWQPGGSLHCFS